MRFLPVILTAMDIDTAIKSVKTKINDGNSGAVGVGVADTVGLVWGFARFCDGKEGVKNGLGTVIFAHEGSCTFILDMLKGAIRG